MIRLTRNQVREVDRIAVEEYGIPGIVLMENAARGVADAITRGRGVGSALIACGPGNNGGDGFAVARHLHLRGWRVAVAELAEHWTGDAAVNRAIARRLPIEFPIGPAIALADCGRYNVLVDAIFGTGLTRPPEGLFAAAIDRLAAYPDRCVAVDLPSGLDCDTGEPIGGACVRAATTVTFVAEKAGFANPASRACTGEVVVADIGAPPEIVARVLQAAPA